MHHLESRSGSIKNPAILAAETHCTQRKAKNFPFCAYSAVKAFCVELIKKSV